MSKSNEDTGEVGFTSRVLMSLVVDVAALREATERVAVQVQALAKEHDIKEAA